MVDVSSDKPPILEALDALIGLDVGVPGFRGTIAIGVRRGPREVTWWSARCTDRARGLLTSTPPEETDVAIVLEAEDGARILRGEPPLAGAAVFGDAELWARFRRRYLGRKGFVNVRLEQNQRAQARGPFGLQRGGR